MSNVLYAGPWNGEFGWELCSWNPLVRRTALEHDRVIVETVPGSEYLYEFADEIITNPRQPNYDMYRGTSVNPIQPPKNPYTNLNPMQHWKRGASIGAAQSCPTGAAPIMSGRAEFNAIKRGSRIEGSLPPREWRVYGTEKPHYVADIMCAFRGPKTFKGKSYPEKQWEEQRCDELVEMFKVEGFTVACYGGSDNYLAPGAIDYLDQPLDELTGALSQAKLSIGPSSGTIHLASLCKTPHVTWYGRPNISMDRYMFYWNPFKTAVTFINIPNPGSDMAFSVSMERMKKDTPILHYV